MGKVAVFTRDSHVVVLPTNAAYTKASQLVRPYPGEDPRDGCCPGELYGIGIRCRSRTISGPTFREISVREIEGGPHQFRPDVVSDYTRIGTNLRAERPGRE